MREVKQLTNAQFAKAGESFENVTLPHTWNAYDGQDGGSDYWRGKGIYNIELPNTNKGKHQYIEFQGANHVAKVRCNGTELGEHKGGFSTFRFELTDVLNETDNLLEVEISNEVCDVYPQQADFTFYGGIYRTVNYIEVEETHFDLMKDGTSAVFVTPHVTGKIRIDAFPINAEICRPFTRRKKYHSIL